ncbi:MAG: DNA-processing protein DprA, partial [Acidimicrobiales bacterium]
MGPAPSRSTAWSAAARRTDVDRSWRSCCRREIHAAYLGGDTYPAALADDPQPPGVIFWRGCLEILEAPCVAIVGTRRCTPDGRATAFELGRDLAAAGVSVISGLALGIDGAAHLGALEAQPGRPVGVAASGVDVPYPRRHARLWDDVAARGAVVSETSPGAPPQAWRFPSRNRIIVALAELVVLVESHESGGSLITADAALARGRDLRVVPGPVHSPASAGTNQLLYDGAGPVRHAEDVLDCLGLIRDRPAGSGDHSRRRARALSRPPRPVPVGDRPFPGGRSATTGGPRVAPVVDATRPGAAEDAQDAQDAQGAQGAQGRLGATRAQPAIGAESGLVLAAVGWQPTSLSAIVERTGSTVSAA